MNEGILIGIEVIILIVGIAGCILPIIPGLAVCYVALLVQHFTGHHTYPIWLLVFVGIIVLGYQLLQWYLPPKISKKFGGSRYAQIGSIVGLIIGIFTSYLGPLGLFIGPFLGAMAGEVLFAKKDISSSMKAGLGAVLGMLLTNATELLLALGIVAIYVQSFF